MTTPTQTTDLWTRLSAGAPFVIAEVGQNHDGSLGQAHAFIDAVAESGADAIKFQTHIAAAESTPEEPFRVNFSYADDTRYDYWQRMEFSESQWQALKDHAEERGLEFLSTPFSLAAIDLLERIGIRLWKVASGEIGSRHMLRRMARSGLPVIVSTGMSDFEEIEAAIALLAEHSAPHVLLQCTSAYPCDAGSVGLNVLDEFKTRFDCPIGLSDHSGTIFPALAATTHGAQVIEVHVTLSKRMFGPDITSSLTIEELSQMVEGIRYTATMRDTPVDKNAVARNLAPMRALFGKSAVAARDLSRGQTLAEDDVVFKKPGKGLPESALAPYFGRPLAHDVKQGAFLSIEDFTE
jgi:N-acetylneuraminate synthase